MRELICVGADKLTHNFKLRNMCGVCLLAVIVLSTFGSDSAYAKHVDYLLNNLSGRVIRNLYIYASGHKNLKDMLGSSVLVNGDTWSMWYENKYRYFDIIIVWSDGSTAEWYRYDFRGMWRLTVYRDGDYYRIRKN